MSTHPMVLPPMNSSPNSASARRPNGRRITGTIEQPVHISGSQSWRDWAIEPGEIDPARSKYIDELLAKRRERLARRG